MSAVGRQPPPFFRRGAAPFARLAFFVIVSLVLIGVDLRTRMLEGVRQTLTVIAHPLRSAALAPAQALGEAGAWLVAQAELKRENARLSEQAVSAAAITLRHRQLEEENRELRRLLEMRARQPDGGTVAEILYAARDPYSRRVVIDKGSRHSIAAGAAVVDDIGVIGQVTRVFPASAEVTLVTDRDQAVPVEVQRNRVRAVLFGAGGGWLEVRYLTAGADVREGDLLVTSGLDGIYLPGLPVGRVSRIEQDGAHSFARILAAPVAAAERSHLVLVLGRRELPQAGTPETGRAPAGRPAGARVRRSR
ncbi:MAG: rod shape-determining protein MreC [Rhodocyclaceae bacterium]